MWPALGALLCGLMLVGPVSAEAGKYLGPIDVVAAADGKTLYVVEADARQIAVVDVAAGKVARTIACPAQPTGLTLSPDGAKLYVTCAAPAGTVSVVDAATGNVAATIPVGHTACGPSVTPNGKRLFVCNQFNNDVSVIDLDSNKELARVKAVREPTATAVAPDGSLVFVTNLLPTERADSFDVAAQVTLIDTSNNSTTQIRLPNGSSSVHEVCVAPDGKYAFVAHILSRYQMPTTQLERGWMNTNALSIIDVAAKKLLNTVLLDDVDLGAANPWAVATTADGKSIVVSHAGTHEISVIQTEGMLTKLAGMPKNIEEAKAAGRYDKPGQYSSVTIEDVPNDLAFLVGLKRRVRLKSGGLWGFEPEKGPLVNGPRGLAVIGSKVYVALYFSDALAVVDLESKAYHPVSLVALGPEPQFTVQRRGEMFFHDADLCFQHWQSCLSCHPNIRVDGLNWDLLNDGLGNPKNTRSMLLAHQTPPSMSIGVREGAEAAVRAGIRNIQFIVRPDEDAQAIDEYLKSLKPVPSPYLVGSQLSEAAQRGKVLFFNEQVGCAHCHPEPLYTDMKMHNVHSKGQFDRNQNEFDTPTLIECWRTAPYMHDGSFTTVRELLDKGKHGRHGEKAAELNEQQLNDLTEFVLSL
jgi:YVTN family beta-propeller protein